MQCIIIEDEPLAVKILQDYIAELPYLSVQGVFKNAILATEHLRTHPVDLIFLDLHLPRLKGLDFLKALENPPAVIVTTAYHQYAVEGYELNVVDYLLKPFRFERFLKALNKVKSALGTTEKQQTSPVERDFIFLPVQKKKVKIIFSDIDFIESQKEYVRIVMGKKEVRSKMGTKEIMEMLPPNQFARVHRSFIVAVSKIDSYSAEAVEINGASIPVGREYRAVLDIF